MEIKPDSSLLKVWRFILWTSYLSTTIFPISLLFIIPLIAINEPYSPFSSSYLGFSIAILIIFVVDTCIVVFVNFWMKKYYNRLIYRIGESGVSIDKGVWWFDHKEIPYDKMVGVSSKQGPLERMYGVGKITIQTAGFGQTAMPEGILHGITNLEEIRKMIIGKMELNKERKGSENRTV